MSALDVAAIAQLFPKAKRLNSGEWTCCCPKHPDETPSMTLGAEGDTLLVHCHRGCDQDALFDHVKDRAREAGLLPNGQAKDWGQIVDEYIYRDEDGEPLFKVIRTSNKKFYQERYVLGSWVKGLGRTRRVTYRLNEWIAESGTVYIAEGEKDVDRLWSLDLPATCNPMGAGHGKWRAEYNKHFADRDVVIIPDMDEEGLKHARVVGTSLINDNIEDVRIAVLDGAKDISEWLDNGHDIGELVYCPITK
jgi:hypothetical protein